MKRALENQNEKKTYSSELNRITMKVNFLNKVKTRLLLLAALSLVLIFTSCEKEKYNVIPSSHVSTRNFSASNINELYVSDVFKVLVSFSETEESVQVEANDNLHSIIEIHQLNNRLIVGLKKNSSISGKPVLNVNIKTASLSKVIAEGAAQVKFDNSLETNRLDVEITGAAEVSGNVKVEKLVANITGASHLDISGESNSFYIDALGASEMKGFEFETNSLKADLYGGCSVSLVVNEKLDVSAEGASSVYYKGNGYIEYQNLKDASRIIKID